MGVVVSLPISHRPVTDNKGCSRSSHDLVRVQFLFDYHTGKLSVVQRYLSLLLSNCPRRWNGPQSSEAGLHPSTGAQEMRFAINRVHLAHKTYDLPVLHQLPRVRWRQETTALYQNRYPWRPIGCDSSANLQL